MTILLAIIIIIHKMRATITFYKYYSLTASTNSCPMKLSLFLMSLCLNNFSLKNKNAFLEEAKSIKNNV